MNRNDPEWWSRTSRTFSSISYQSYFIPELSVQNLLLMLLDPFSEKFIQGVVKQLGQQSINVETLTPSDLDQLSEVITQALQVVDDAKGVKGREVKVDDEGTMKKESEARGQPGGAVEDLTAKGRRWSVRVLCFYLMVEIQVQ